MYDLTPAVELSPDGQMEALHVYNDLTDCGYDDDFALCKFEIVLMAIALDMIRNMLVAASLGYGALICLCR